MKKTFRIFTLLFVALFTFGCSGVKVLDSWKSDNLADIKDNNILVIARTENKQARIAFEQQISEQLRANGVKATESFRELPEFNHDNKEITEQQKKNFQDFLKNEGYNGIILTVLKDYQERTETTQDGGYYAGATYMPAYYPGYYGGFYGYYYHPLSYSTYGSYVPSSTTTRTVKTFILETVIYDLTKDEKQQLAAVVTTQIEDPQDVTKNAAEYTQKVTKALTE
ncbi:hypothetical protein [Hanstruepera flava]|uniref:hypothetical protein n=1 Tax=Hanstruepera flava TaxID=2930218 RepID=UPI002027BE6A|nr:hypothetical protein [Hanstruepera flava]